MAKRTRKRKVYCSAELKGAFEKVFHTPGETNSGHRWISRSLIVI